MNKKTQDMRFKQAVIMYSSFLEYDFKFRLAHGWTHHRCGLLLFLQERRAYDPALFLLYLPYLFLLILAQQATLAVFHG